MTEIADWVGRVKEILGFIVSRKIGYAEIVLTVKGGKVAFVDYRGPLRGMKDEE